MFSQPTNEGLLKQAIKDLNIFNCKKYLNKINIDKIDNFVNPILEILNEPKINSRRNLFNKAVAILEIFLEQGMFIDIDKIDKDIFHRLLVEYPNTAYKILDLFQKRITNQDDNLKHIEYLKSSLKEIFFVYSVLGFIVGKEGEFNFVDCLQLMFGFLEKNNINYKLEK